MEIREICLQYVARVTANLLLLLDLTFILFMAAPLSHAMYNMSGRRLILQQRGDIKREREKRGEKRKK